MIPALSNLNLRHKFFAWSTLILISFSLLLSLFYYFHLRSLLIKEALDKSELILQEVESIRDYVKEVLRPKMIELHSGDTFIIEAMSTTHVSLSIMRRFGEKKEGYLFRRVSLNPLNPENHADPFEEEMFDWFEEDKKRKLWQGIVRRDGKSYFVSMIPDYFETSCLACHGDYRNAPKSLVERYGTEGGFRFKKGDLGGINSVSIPVSTSLALITRDAVIVFLVILAFSFLCLFLLNLMFAKLVIERLNRVNASLLQENGDAKPQTEKKTATTDELEHLRLSLQTLRRYVKTARKGTELQPDFIGPYTIGNPIAAGTLSWLYSAHDEEKKMKVTLKQGFPELMVNPVYAACYRTELKILKKIKHKNLLLVIEQRGDSLILEPVAGKVAKKQWSQEEKKTTVQADFFKQLCDLVAALHTAGIVHHDLRPGVFLHLEDGTCKLFDMGHASHRDIPDVILSSGLGPQGDFRFMAPELLQGLRGDPRSDIYSIGILLYLFTTGKFPFAETEKTSSIVTWLHRKKNPVAPRSHKASLSHGLEAIIMQAMAYELDERYQWVEDLWEDLDKKL